MKKISTKFTTALDGLLSMNIKDALSLSGEEVAKKYNCATTCANYAIQALKYILANRK